MPKVFEFTHIVHFESINRVTVRDSSQSRHSSPVFVKYEPHKHNITNDWQKQHSLRNKSTIYIFKISNICTTCTLFVNKSVSEW